ncbi:MAG: lipoprotein [Gammaproteobacteria bacterium]|nr:lipoprotein [Gammaproteobacteria bacterium]
MQRRTTLKTSTAGRLRVCSLAFFLTLILTACGNKGDLYLPASDMAPAKETAQTELSQTEQQQGQ